MNNNDPSIASHSDPAHRGQALQYLVDIVMSEGASRNAPDHAARAQLSASVAGWRPTRQKPADLVGRDCPLSPPQWHWKRLLELAGRAETPDCGADRTRRLYHARWLAHLLAPERAAFQPRVTILVPVFNRAAMAAEAIESCLAQDWKALEILVIDDGSTDDLAGALARFGDGVCLHRQPNGGVSSARNAGIRLASGDFVHFLDSDNLLLPSAVSRKVEAFAHFADAELCYSLAKVEGGRAVDLPQIVRPGHGPNCPTISLLNCGSLHPFYVSCVMLPRFTLLATGGFEEDLRRGEDTRFWGKLALCETKVIGFDAELTLRRVNDSSLSATQIDPSLHFTIRARMISDLLGSARAWLRAIKTYRSTLHLLLGDGASAPLSAAPERELSKLLAAICELGVGGRRDGLSPLPLLAHLRHLTWGGLAARPAMRRAEAGPLRKLHATIDTAARRAARLAPSDLAFWTSAPSLSGSGRRLQSFMEHAGRLLASNPAALPAVDELLRDAPTIPDKRTVRAYLRLRRWKLPRSLALNLARRKPR